MTGKRNAYRIFVGKLERKSALRKPRRRAACNIKIDFYKVELGAMEWNVWFRIQTGCGLLLQR